MRLANRVFVSLLLIVAALVMLAGCGGGCSTSSFSTGGSGSGGGKTEAGTVCGPGSGGPGGPSAVFVFYLDGLGVETASLSTSGSFAQVTGLTPATPAGGIIDDMVAVNDKFLYLPFGDINGVQALAIDNTTGALTPITGSPFLLPAGTADSVVTDPLGRFLFVGSEGIGSISVYQIDATTGALTLTPGSPFTSFNLSSADSLAVDGTGKFLYAGQLISSVPLAAFSIDQNTGALSEIAGSPFNLGVAQIHADPSGKFLLGVAEIADQAGVAVDNHISVFAIDATTGALAPVAGSPFLTSGAPFDFMIHPNGKFVYTTGNTPGGGSVTPIEGFQLDSTTGALTALPGSPFTGLLGALCRLDPTGGVMFCDPDDTGSAYTVFTVNATTGALTNTGTTLAVSYTPFAWAAAN